MTDKPTLIIFYDWFYPGFRAGGPIQSLYHLSVILAQQYRIMVITGATDINNKTPYPGIKLNEWNNVDLPDAQSILVYYNSRGLNFCPKLKNVLRSVQPATIYLNGLFSPVYFILPLLLLHLQGHQANVVVCPRGMLQASAISSKRLKKQSYFSFLRWTGWLNTVVFHATSSQEKAEIMDHFPVHKQIITAPNIPKLPYFNVSQLSKAPGELKLVYMSLINSHKNLLLLLQCMQLLPPSVTLSVYGPVVEPGYFSQCEELIEQLGPRVLYKGEVQPQDVQFTLSGYHALVLLTKGENFGHAIYECLSVGRPVVTSNHTPWNTLRNEKAGFNVDINYQQDCLSAMLTLAAMDQLEYDQYCNGAHAVAQFYYHSLRAGEQYKHLFG